MPSVVHNATAIGWNNALTFALNNLTQTPQPTPPGCFGVGGACTYNCMLHLALRSPTCTLAIHLGPRQKQADAGIGPAPGNPSVVLEVGDSESLTQLKIDARLWLERIPEVCLDSLLSSLFSCFVYSLRCQVQLVFLISIDPAPSRPPNNAKNHCPAVERSCRHSTPTCRFNNLPKRSIYGLGSRLVVECNASLCTPR